MDHLSYFEPYTRKEAHHEDQLTRAFIVVLKHVPVVHAAWLLLVDRAHRDNQGDGVPPLHALPEPVFSTQVCTLPLEVERVVSVLQSDEQYAAEDDATASERSQVLDGVITYPPSLAVVVENKPSVANVWRGQLDVNTPEGVRHDPRVASVRWRDVLETFTNLLSARHIRGSEAILMEDFLGFVERRFPQLQPFNRLAVCGRDLARLERRCRAILEEIAPGNVQYHRGWGWYIELHERQPATQVSLVAQEHAGAIRLFIEFDPGDTMGQARLLYARANIEGILRLADEGWEVTSNFHFAFMSSNLVWTAKSADIRRYLEYWKKNVTGIVQVKRADFQAYFNRLIESGFASGEDIPKFEQHFVNTSRQAMNVCPGVTLRRIWPLDDAVQLDANAKLSPLVRRNIEGVLSLWGDSLPQPEEMDQLTAPAGSTARRSTGSP